MKNTILLFVSAFILTMTGTVAQAAKGGIEVSDFNVEQVGDELSMSFVANVAKGTAPKGMTVAYAPFLTDGRRKVALPAIIVHGKGAAKMWERHEWAADEAVKYADGHYIKNGDKVQYNINIPYQRWMYDLKLELDALTVSCCNSYSDVLVVENNILPLPEDKKLKVERYYAYVTDDGEYVEMPESELAQSNDYWPVEDDEEEETMVYVIENVSASNRNQIAAGAGQPNTINPIGAAGAVGAGAAVGAAGIVGADGVVYAYEYYDLDDYNQAGYSANADGVALSYDGTNYYQNEYSGAESSSAHTSNIGTVSGIGVAGGAGVAAEVSAKRHVPATQIGGTPVKEREYNTTSEPKRVDEAPTMVERVAEVLPFILPAEEFDPEEPVYFNTGDSEDALTIYFRINESTIDPEYADNDQMLLNLIAAIEMINHSNQAKVEQLVVAGFASPDGPTEFNDRLAQERAIAVKEYILENTDMRDEDIALFNGSADWDGLRLLVENDRLVPSRRRVLDVLDYPLWDSETLTGRLSILRTLDNGWPYVYIADNLLPQLRTGTFIRLYYSYE